MAGRFGVKLCRVCKVRVILASDKGDTRVEHISEDISNDTLPHGAVRLMRNVLALRSLKRNVGRPRRWETLICIIFMQPRGNCPRCGPEFGNELDSVEER